MKINKILIVDDDRDFLRALTLRLKANNYQVVQAVDAGSAIVMTSRESPDLIVLDLGLPGGDGFLIMQRLKSAPSTAALPVIVLTAKDAEGNQERAYEAGAADFLQKPVNNEWLLGAIEGALDVVQHVALQQIAR
ncbi:MAG TPA: response regulator [Terriglobia bacterium]|nr:response regulator [Terriglobia bacterium]